MFFLQGEITWHNMYTFETGLSNSGAYTFDPVRHVCEPLGTTNQCLDFEVGAIQINKSPADPISPR